MPRKSMRLLAVATAVIAVSALVAPSTALAKHKKKGHPSAVDVYVEQVQTATGNQASSPTGGPATGASTYKALPAKAKRKLMHHGGKDTGLLIKVATHPGFNRKLAVAGNVNAPGTLDAAFDIGAGPAVLFALVLGTGLFVAVGGGLRGLQRRRTR